MPLRKASFGRQESKWTKDEILEGLIKFLEENKRFPTSYEINTYPYLLSARSIQRSFGGIQYVKKELGIEENYHSGLERSKISIKIGERGVEIEDSLALILIEHFGEFAVHCQSKMVGNRERLDFLVYHAGGKFGVDIFYAESIQSLQGSINLKQKKYGNFTENLYMVCDGEFSNEELQTILDKKKNKLESNIKMVGKKDFVKEVLAMSPLRVISSV